MVTHTFEPSTVSLVIGGHSGIGQALVEALAARPGRVVAASRRTGLKLCDVAPIKTCFERVGHIDHLVITADSSASAGHRIDVDLKAAKASSDISFWDSVDFAREAAKWLRPDGTITLTSGFLPRCATTGTSTATMSAKFQTVAKLLAKELAPIRVNVVSPGQIDAEASAQLMQVSRNAMQGDAAANFPALRHGHADDIARGYLFVIDNPFVTGAVVDSDGRALIDG